MKYFITVLFILLFSINTQAQFTKVQVVDAEDNPIPYVSIEYLNKLAITDSLGKTKLSSGNFEIKLSHVSYQTKNAKLKSDSNEIKIRLNLKSDLLNAVTIKTDDKTYTAYPLTNFRNHKKVNVYFLFHSNVKVGAWIYNKEYSYNECYLKEISFDLSEGKLKKRLNTNTFLEVKLFPVVMGKIGSDPINLRPIYILINKHQKQIHVEPMEKIKIPPQGFFVSFELPKVDSTNTWTLSFTGSNTISDCVFFAEPLKTYSWNANTLNKNCIPIQMQTDNGIKYFNPNYTMQFYVKPR